MGETEQSVLDGAIELHPEIVRQRQDTYSSLTDLYGVDVFSDEFNDSVETIENQQKESEQQLGKAIFVEEVSVVEDSDTQLLSQLFTTQEEMVLSQNYAGSDTGVSVMDVSLVLIGVLAVAALYLFLFSDKKARRNKT